MGVAGQTLGVADLLGPFLEAIFRVISQSYGAATRAVGAYDGRRVRWSTVAAASFASALYVPFLVGSFFGVSAVWDLFESDFLFFIGLLFILPAFLVVAMAASAVGLGVTVGAWLLVDRPESRWYAGFFAVAGLVSGAFVLSMQTWVTRVIGGSTVGLAVALIVAVLLPAKRVTVAPTEPAAAESAPPELSFTTPRTQRRRFVL